VGSLVYYDHPVGVVRIIEKKKRMKKHGGNNFLFLLRKMVELEGPLKYLEENPIAVLKNTSTHHPYFFDGPTSRYIFSIEYCERNLPSIFIIFFFYIQLIDCLIF